MAITDLAGTSWLINASPSMTATFDVYINFKSDGNSTRNYTRFRRYSQWGSTSSLRYYYSTNSYDTPYNGTTWSSTEYRTIHITGGDTTNATLISWLEANATQIVESNPNIYIGVNNIASKVTNVYVGVSNKARKVIKAYIGDESNKARLFYNTTTTSVNTWSFSDEHGVYYFERCPDNTSDTYYFGNLTKYDSYWCRSNNKGIGNSEARSVINFDIKSPCRLTIDIVDYQNEGHYDYGRVTYLDSSTGEKYTGINAHTAGGETLDYGTVAVGSHFIYIYYKKDSSDDNPNDRLYFRVNFDGVPVAPTT